jgi:hypothetical protein
MYARLFSYTTRGKDTSEKRMMPGKKQIILNYSGNLHWDDNNLLAKLAIRVFHTLANEVPSERVFSAMNILHSKPRNRLTEDRVDKLLFIQINLRTLRRRKRQREPQSEEIDESESEDGMDASPYQIIPWIVQRVSSDASTAGTTPIGPVQATLPGLQQLESPDFGPI